ncbi:hypothetical protein GCM10025868_35370 [Angustibacter aerolatus]|uniref:Uncharacterized protein n=1 Tax=Angustibacter aerolatus TaxID=1162965 RepID=A0ABQ6JJ56_9ACTN|nr:hypothetical protein GCM10025868_35370 [Angustibacter aerolatus]
MSAVRGVGLPTHVPLAGPSQRLARALVGALLITGAVAGPAAAVGPADGGAGPARATSVSASVLPGGGAGVLLTDEARAAAASTADVASVAADPEHAVLAGHKVYTVQKPDGRYHDNLWDIAERHLGDGRRYKEIYQAERGSRAARRPPPRA